MIDDLTPKYDAFRMFHRIERAVAGCRALNDRHHRAFRLERAGQNREIRRQPTARM